MSTTDERFCVIVEINGRDKLIKQYKDDQWAIRKADDVALIYEGETVKVIDKLTNEEIYSTTSEVVIKYPVYGPSGKGSFDRTPILDIRKDILGLIKNYGEVILHLHEGNMADTYLKGVGFMNIFKKVDPAFVEALQDIDGLEIIGTEVSLMGDIVKQHTNPPPDLTKIEPHSMTREELIADPDIKFDELLGFVVFRENVPLDEIIPGELETPAEKHVGTRFVSRTIGPILLLYSPKYNVYKITNGHHRWAEAKVRGDSTIEAWVSVLNEDRGFGAMTHKDFIRKALNEGREVPDKVLKEYPELKTPTKITPRSYFSGRERVESLPIIDDVNVSSDYVLGEVIVDDIIGVVGVRGEDYTPDWHPKKPGSRFIKVYERTKTIGKIESPVDLLLIGKKYWVLDGSRRVSVANVLHLKSVPASIHHVKLEERSSKTFLEEEYLTIINKICDDFNVPHIFDLIIKDDKYFMTRWGYVTPKIVLSEETIYLPESYIDMHGVGKLILHEMRHWLQHHEKVDDERYDFISEKLYSERYSDLTEIEKLEVQEIDAHRWAYDMKDIYPFD